MIVFRVFSCAPVCLVDFNMSVMITKWVVGPFFSEMKDDLCVLSWCWFLRQVLVLVSSSEFLVIRDKSQTCLQRGSQESNRSANVASRHHTSCVMPHDATWAGWSSGLRDNGVNIKMPLRQGLDISQLVLNHPCHIIYVTPNRALILWIFYVWLCFGCFLVLQLFWLTR